MAEDLKENALVRIVDDDPDIRESLQMMLESEGWKSASFAGAEAFLIGDMPSVPGVVLLDIQMDGMNGMDLQEAMIDRGYSLPIIFVTGHGSISIAVEAMRKGAFDFLEKPVNPSKLLQSIEAAAFLSLTQSANIPNDDQVKEALDRLTDRQKEVLRHLLAKEGVRVVSEKLGISLRTVQGHRVQIYKAFGIHRFAQLYAVRRQIEALLAER